MSQYFRLVLRMQILWCTQRENIVSDIENLMIFYGLQSVYENFYCPQLSCGANVFLLVACSSDIQYLLVHLPEKGTTS